jgi:hypothetical protein
MFAKFYFIWLSLDLLLLIYTAVWIDLLVFLLFSGCVGGFIIMVFIKSWLGMKSNGSLFFLFFTVNYCGNYIVFNNFLLFYDDF